MQNACLFDQWNDDFIFNLALQPIISLNFSSNLTKLSGLLTFPYGFVFTPFLEVVQNKINHSESGYHQPLRKAGNIVTTKVVKKPADSMIFTTRTVFFSFILFFILYNIKHIYRVLMSMGASVNIT